MRKAPHLFHFYGQKHISKAKSYYLSLNSEGKMLYLLRILLYNIHFMCIVLCKNYS
jgi:hypothetical protein